MNSCKINDREIIIKTGKCSIENAEIKKDGKCPKRLR